MRSDPFDKAEALIYDPSAEAIKRHIEAGLDNRGISLRIVACDNPTPAGRYIADTEILISGPFPPELLKGAENLRWVQSLWSGVDSWLEAPLNEDVPITRMPGEVFAEDMAEYVFAHLLYDAQNMEHYRDAQRHREWQPIPSASLHSRVLGVAGLGAVGRTVAYVGKTLGMRVVGLRRELPARGYGSSNLDQVFGREDLHDFLTQAQILVLALPATSETRGMFGFDQLRMLPSGAIVINIGRGQVIDQEALIELLREGQLSRAILDTFEVEPLPPTSPLWGMPNVTVTPHVSGRGHPIALAEVCVENIATYLRGLTPEPVLDVTMGY